MPVDRQAKLAFIGCGGFATAAIFPNIPLVPEIDLVAVCDVVREKAELNARNFGARRAYTDMEEMLDKEELDGVFVIGPAPQQYELIPHVLRRGIPVYTEKPSANKAAEALDLVNIARANETWGQVGFMKRFCHAYLMALDIISREEFGPVHLVKCKFSQGPYPQIWGMDSAKRSMLVGQLCHIFDLVRFFGGDVKTVQAMFHGVTDTQFAYLVNLEFASGAHGQLDLNGLEHLTGFRDIEEVLQLVGLETHVIVEDMMRLRWQTREDFTSVCPDRGRYSHEFHPAWPAFHAARAFGYTGEVAHFAKRCLGLVDGGPDLWDSYRSLQIGEAIYDSAFDGAKAVSIEL